MTNMKQALAAALGRRFGGADAAAADGLPETALATLAGMARRGSVRRFADRPVPVELLRLLAGVALSAPSKSDLQQRDIVLITDPALRRALDDLLAAQNWISGAPALLMVCGDHRRQRRLHQLRGRPFANHHLDAFFNASVDAAIALGAFVTAAEAAGLGCCPISAVRNQADAVSRLLELPDLVFPVAGLAVGWPIAAPEISLRLPLAATLHENRYTRDDAQDDAHIAAYDARRAAAQPHSWRRAVRGGDADDTGTYVWSEDKARQYSTPERADFGAFVRAKGFSLE